MALTDALVAIFVITLVALIIWAKTQGLSLSETMMDFIDGVKGIFGGGQ